MFFFNIEARPFVGLNGAFEDDLGVLSEKIYLRMISNLGL